MTRFRWAFIAIVAIGMIIAQRGHAIADATTAPSTTRPVQQPADIPAPKIGRDQKVDARFLQMHESFLQRRTQGPIDLLFLGDSITELWGSNGKEVWAHYYGKLNAANFGISGDQTQHVLWRIENGELDGISPKVVVLMIGTNNLTRYPADIIVKADKLIVQRIHEKLPNTKVLLLGIFPRGPDPKIHSTAFYRAKIKIVNAELATFEDGDKTRYLDIGDKFLNDDGSLPRPIMPDFLHPSAAGYQLWADAMAPLLNEMLK
jgi:lysophospholipase L1-like esterase